MDERSLLSWIRPDSGGSRGEKGGRGVGNTEAKTGESSTDECVSSANAAQCREGEKGLSLERLKLTQL